MYIIAFILLILGIIKLLLLGTSTLSDLKAFQNFPITTMKYLILFGVFEAALEVICAVGILV